MSVCMLVGRLDGRLISIMITFYSILIKHTARVEHLEVEAANKDDNNAKILIDLEKQAIVSKDRLGVQGNK